MRILVVSPDDLESGSGIASVVRFQRKLLEKKGHKIHIMCRNGDGALLYSKNSGILGTIPFWRKVTRYISSSGQEYDLVWLHSPLLLSGAWSDYHERAPVCMVTFHSTYLGLYQAFKKHGSTRLLPYYWVASRLERIFLEKATRKRALYDTAFVAVSPSVREELRMNGLRRIIKVIPNGECPNPKFQPSRADVRERIREHYSVEITDDDHVLLYVGRLTEVKQPHLVANVFNSIAKHNDSLHLLLVGSGNLRRRLQEEFGNYSRIHFLGNIPHDDIWDFYFGADAFISLSCYEGNSVSVLEAISAKMPLILSDIPAHRWIIESKIGKGMLVSSRNPAVSEIARFLDSLRMGNPHFSERPLTWEKNCDQYLESIQELVNG